MVAFPLAATTWDDAEFAAIQRVIDSRMFTMGSEVRAFETEFAAYVGARHAVMVNSGSSANLLAVAACTFRAERPIQPGAIAVVPAVSWPTTYYPLTQYGLRLRFVDIDPKTLNFDLDALAAAIDDDVRVIFAVNLLGNPNDFDAINAIIAGRDITLLEDNCESLGATFGGKQTGTFGAIGTYSAFFSHHISTMEGGVCVTDDEELYHILLSLRAHGWTRNLPWPNKLVEKDPRGDFHELFRFVLPGYNVRPLEMSGAIGREQLKKLPGLIEGRRSNAARFQDLFSDIPGVSIQEETGDSSWFGFAFVLDDAVKKSRDEVVAVLRNAGIECRPIVAGNFYRNPVIAHMPHEPVAAPLTNADKIHDRGFFIGNHHWDVRDDLIEVRNTLLRALES